MLTELRQQWKERCVRKSAYITPGKTTFEPINFADYQRSTSRSEMPNRYKKHDLPKVQVEAVYELSTAGPIKSDKANLASQKAFQRSVLKSASPKPFYYLENNEIISLDKFFNVYRDLKAFHKKQEKFEYQRRLQEKRKKIEEIHLSAMKSNAHSVSGNISTANHTIQPTGETIPSVYLPNRYTKESKDTSMNMKGLSMEQESLRGMTTNQKFTEREVCNHLVHMTVSPKPLKVVSGELFKEKVFYSMFKDPKVMDYAVENSIRRAHNMIIKKAGLNESHGILPKEEEDIIRTVNSIGEVETAKDILPNDVNTLSTKEDYDKKAKGVARRIENNIKHIEGLLRSRAPTEMNKSINYKHEKRKKVSKSVVEAVRVKNKLPLRSTIAQKYGLDEKIRDHKDMSRKIKDITKNLRKEMKDSEMNNQSYLSLYH